MHRRSKKLPVLFVLAFIVAIIITAAVLWKYGYLIPGKYLLLAFFLGVSVISAVLVFIVSKLGR